jgi:hypothetical protein
MIYNDNKLVFLEEHCIWVDVQESNYIIELEKVNFKKITRKVLKYIFPMLWTSLLFSTKVVAKETNPFRVYKDSKELDNFFENVNSMEEPQNSYTNDFSKTFSIILMLLNIINNLQISKNQKITAKYLEINQLNILENQKTLNTLLMTGGKLAVVLSLGFYTFSILVLIRLANSTEFKDKLKEFESKQIFVFILQIFLLACSIFLEDIKKIPSTLTRLKLQKKIVYFFSEYVEIVIRAFLFVGGLYFFLEYGLFPVLFKKYPEFEIFLDRYNLRLNDGETTDNLKKLQKRIKILETIAIKDKAMIKVASTAALLERTYDKKLYSGMKHEMLRLMNELPVKSRNESYKPTYFYKIHESYRIKQNLLALVYFLIYMNIIEKLEEKFPMMKDLPLDELNKQNNSSESF